MDMKKQIGVLTATRAEFGLLKPLIISLMKADFCDVKVLVTGAHLTAAFGNTYKEIEEAGIPIAAEIECVSEGDSQADISNNMAMALTGFGKYFADNYLDLLIVLGDRYEALSVCIAAMNAEIPIAHIHGGEITQGLIDEAIRHSITKMSQLHFVCTEVYRNRVIQMGENPCRVFNVGALAVENIRNTYYISKEELGKDIGIDLSRDYAVVTFHPVTLEANSGVEQFDQLMCALDEFPEMSFVITKANADAGGRHINQKIDEYADIRSNVIAVTSLGVRRYLSAVKESTVVIGNSSSGIIEAPCLHIPTVNIGDRQKGRLMPESVLCCEPDKESIVNTIKQAISDDFREKVKAMTNPFGDGNTSARITEIIRETFEKSGKINIKKDFYDIEVNG
ncbi:UDP-N-acetylglucosamine 2-epimerase [Butyrivibrio sp. MB2005]|uniref:UDP-N-acetylglucosamine 2-epimerase n=1 Tax=Butyrivibrio sp. MB2005 TaxID=1280678 RepID=UPI0004002FD4|nr:UDP-N-acetylglucosamine 2-epimerase [Butyrivibrio sp. MB2005]